MANAAKQPPTKKYKVADHISMEWTGPEDEGVKLCNLRIRYTQYEVLPNTWAMAGCHDVKYEGQDVKYCHWMHSTKYVKTLRSRTEHFSDSFTHDSVDDYFVTVEAAPRAHAMEMTRSRINPIPWGCALEKTLKEFAHEWQEHREFLKPLKISGGGNAWQEPSTPQKHEHWRLTRRFWKSCKRRKERLFLLYWRLDGFLWR